MLIPRSTNPVMTSHFKTIANANQEVLTRQPSLYSMTFDELQSVLGGRGVKEFGSMNMDELLKSIWTEEGHDAAAGVANNGSNLQRQGSLALSRTLSQMTVDEVWKDLLKECNATPPPYLPQRQLTLGEITLEEFLVRAGVVRDDPVAQQEQIPNSSHSIVPSANTNFNGNYTQTSPFLQQPLYPKPANVPIGVKIQTSSPENVPKSDGDPPTPYVFNGRKRAPAIEKVIERRQRRMIKNRESAARSRARKQAYTLELEAEVAKLKEMNQKLQRHHDELVELQKNQMQVITQQNGGRRSRLRRTVTGPW